VQQFKAADSISIADTEVNAAVELVPSTFRELYRAKSSFPVINTVTSALRAIVNEK
jgi:hypothetical protein